jgi:indolepyruvate ferredoxin oxidoreductase, beta subunit
VSNVTNVLLVGVGGQGAVLAGKLLATAVELAGLDVKYSELHGMSQRGGSVVTQVRLGDRVLAPVIDPGCADFVVAFELLEGLRWAHMLRPGGMMLVSTQRIEPATVRAGAGAYPADAVGQIAARGRVCAVDAPLLAARAGTARAANVVLMGCLAAVLDLPRPVWDRALAQTVPAQFLEANKCAFDAGWRQTEPAPQGVG